MCTYGASEASVCTTPKQSSHALTTAASDDQHIKHAVMTTLVHYALSLPHMNAVSLLDHAGRLRGICRSHIFSLDIARSLEAARHGRLLAQHAGRNALQTFSEHVDGAQFNKSASHCTGTRSQHSLSASTHNATSSRAHRHIRRISATVRAYRDPSTRYGTAPYREHIALTSTHNCNSRAPQYGTIF